LVAIAVSLGKQGEKEKAISLLSHWIKAAEKNGDLDYTLYMAAMAYVELGVTTKDNAFLEQAIKTRDSDDPNIPDSKDLLIAIAKSYARLGEKEKTRSLLLRAINLPAEELEIWMKNRHLNDVAHACSESVESTKDRAVLEDATNVAERMGDGYSKINALNAIAESYARLGDKDKARALLSDTLKIAEGISDGNFKGGSLDHIAFSYARLGELTKDRTMLEEALNMADRIGAYEIELDNNSRHIGRSGGRGFLNVIAKSYARLGETKRDMPGWRKRSA
jgi:tetratricopeptide (TPR) repeat protein